ncbi:MAG: hypothetical protein SR1Q5_00715 [Quinella sp. 1Q5]|nr:hypothetical protein [Quinella sp. 1Q5]
MITVMRHDLRHDLRHNYRLIYMMIQAGKTEKAKQHIETQEISNYYDEEVVFDEKNTPYTFREGYGLGKKIILRPKSDEIFQKVIKPFRLVEVYNKKIKDADK